MNESTWRKSSRSGSGAEGGQECIEVTTLGRSIGIRDSKAPDAGHLTLTPQAFADLLTRARKDDLTP